MSATGSGCAHTKGTMAVKVGASYKFDDYPQGPGTEPTNDQQLIDPRSGVKCLFNDLTDELCATIVTAAGEGGNTPFSLLTDGPSIFNLGPTPGEGNNSFAVEIYNGSGTNGIKAAYLQSGKLVNYYENDTKNQADGDSAIVIPNPEGVSGTFQVCIILVVASVVYYSNYYSATF